MQETKEDNALEAFRRDMKEIQYQQIKRFPTFIINDRSQNGIIMTGYRPYSILKEALQHVVQYLKKSKPIINLNEYESFWGTLTQKEKEEISAIGNGLNISFMNNKLYSEKTKRTSKFYP